MLLLICAVWVRFSAMECETIDPEEIEKLEQELLDLLDPGPSMQAQKGPEIEGTSDVASEQEIELMTLEQELEAFLEATLPETFSPAEHFLHQHDATTPANLTLRASVPIATEQQPFVVSSDNFHERIKTPEHSQAAVGSTSTSKKRKAEKKKQRAKKLRRKKYLRQKLLQALTNEEIDQLLEEFPHAVEFTEWPPELPPPDRKCLETQFLKGFPHQPGLTAAILAVTPDRVAKPPPPEPPPCVGVAVGVFEYG